MGEAAVVDRCVSDFAARLRRAYRIHKIILFGSRARGDHLKHSDYDFVIVSPEFEGKRFSARTAEMYQYWDADVGIEPLCYTPDEFERKRKQITIVRQAVREGIEV
ncbi:MAG: nucleotidyltransferase domain-containing protein [Armatimonadota bacterium]